MRVRWSGRARAQLHEIVSYVAKDRPTAAEKLVEGLLERVAVLAEFPEQGRQWEPDPGADLRAVVHGSYRIIYRVGQDELSILSVRHTRRAAEGWLRMSGTDERT